MREEVQNYINRFAQGVERFGSGSVKWDNLKNVYGTKDILPMWVADTDFPSPDEVVEALRRKVEHGVFGYSFPGDSVYEEVQLKLFRDYGWKVEKEWIVFIDGIVGGLYSGVEAVSAKNENILIQQPVYFPFMTAIKDKSRNLVNNQLDLISGKYRMNLEDLKKCFDERNQEPGARDKSAIKAAILCNPHNPVGRVWSEEELKSFGEICLKNGAVVISDEIHCDILLNGKKFTPFASISKEFENQSITFMAASKTFNVAGLHQAYAVIPNQEIRKSFNLVRSGMNWGNGFGLTALEYSYRCGKVYNEALNLYIWDNYVYFRDFLEKRIPKLKVIEPEGTFLLWVDFSETLLSEDEIKKILVENCKIGVNAGSAFGGDRQGFMRFNIGCSRKHLEQALKSLEKFFK